ncbi:hypothetical protein [Methanobacterium formicicum]|jgi:hypothetical protein|uniref:Putative membrane protein n=1 Tax=Methanobacterium formicicum TaxID=2162 RepID=A0A090I6Q6_METFO|nr:hypothetical protein [Methanobacterium formicicum]MDH2659725.1 hypothetical protein [Methanobacterium formicicum]CEA12757.1 putative membrane protein [Methanobacterium formicicum]
MVDTRIRKTRSEREFEEAIDEYITMGYKVQSRGEKTAQLLKAQYGSLLSHILILIFFCWTFLLANLLWLVYNYYSKSDKVLVKLIEDNETIPSVG